MSDSATNWFTATPINPVDQPVDAGCDTTRWPNSRKRRLRKIDDLMRELAAYIPAPEDLISVLSHRHFYELPRTSIRLADLLTSLVKGGASPATVRLTIKQEIDDYVNVLIEELYQRCDGNFAYEEALTLERLTKYLERQRSRLTRRGSNREEDPSDKMGL